MCGSRSKADGPDVTVKGTLELTMMRCDRRGVRGAEVWAALPTDADASRYPVWWTVLLLPGCGGGGCGEPGAECECTAFQSEQNRKKACGRLSDSGGRPMTQTGKCVCNTEGRHCVAQCKGSDGGLRPSSARVDEVLSG